MYWVMAIALMVVIGMDLPNAEAQSVVDEAVESSQDQAPESAEPEVADTSGWDWDSFEVMDDTPKVKGRTTAKSEAEATDAPATPKKAIETTEPDFEGDIRPAYALFPDAPDFSVIPSKRDRDMHPCANCHTWTKSDPTPRPLKPPHDNFELNHGLHGKGKFWCFTCHTLEGQGGLRTFEGQPLDFSEAYVLCSQCHVRQARDWVYGAHGKRVDNWQGERRVYNCTVCHYQHRPAPKPRAPLAGPQARQAMEHPAHWVPIEERAGRVVHEKPVWERRGHIQNSEGER